MMAYTSPPGPLSHYARKKGEGELSGKTIGNVYMPLVSYNGAYIGPDFNRAPN